MTDLPKIKFSQASIGDFLCDGTNMFKIVPASSVLRFYYVDAPVMQCVGSHPLVREEFTDQELKLLNLTPEKLRQIKAEAMRLGMITIDYFAHDFMRKTPQNAERMRAMGKQEYMARYLQDKE